MKTCKSTNQLKNNTQLNAIFCCSTGCFEYAFEVSLNYMKVLFVTDLKISVLAND